MTFWRGYYAPVMHRKRKTACHVSGPMFVVAGSNGAHGITGLYVCPRVTRCAGEYGCFPLDDCRAQVWVASRLRMHGPYRASLTYQTTPSGVPRAAGARALSAMIGGGAVLMKVVSLIMAPRFSDRSIRASWYGSREMKARQDGTVFPRNGETSGK
jgi:hypothetical protein